MSAGVVVRELPVDEGAGKMGEGMEAPGPFPHTLLRVPLSFGSPELYIISYLSV